MIYEYQFNLLTNYYKMKKKLIVVDSNSLFCAGYYGLRKYDLSTEDGIPTGGIYAFLTMLSNVIKRHSPDDIIFTFDTATSKNANKENLEEYKGNRSVKPDDFFFQLNKVREILPKLWFDVFESPSFEADDVIATKVNQHKDSYEEVFVRTGDTDMYQLIEDKVKIIKSDKIFWIPELKAKFESEQFLPEHYVLYKSLVWDSSDNVSGIDKVGPKTAIKILTESEFDKEKVFEHSRVKDFTDIVNRNLKIITLNRSINEDAMVCFKWTTNEDWICENLTNLWIKSINMENFKLAPINIETEIVKPILKNETKIQTSLF